MLRLFTIPALAVCVAGADFIHCASAQTQGWRGQLPVRHVDTAELKKASVDLQNEFKPRQDQLEKVQRELADIQARLQASAGKC